MDKVTRTDTSLVAGRGRAAVFAIVALMIALLACSQMTPAEASSGQSLIGLFKLTPGSWHGSASGTYFRMVQSGSTAAKLTYLANTSSKAGDQTYTLLSPGTDGGIRTGSYQSTPNPAFDGSGNALSGKVTAPTPFFGVNFATATNQKDPQTGQQTAVPMIYANGTSLSGNLSAFAASWNNQNFNQGSPKPDGTSPGLTQPVSGTYNPSTHAFTLTWRSLIVGGPFNAFTGEWHLTGTFVASQSTTTPPSSSSHSTPTRTPTPATSKGGGGAGVTKTSPTTSSAAKSSATTASSAASTHAGSSSASSSVSGTVSAAVTAPTPDQTTGSAIASAPDSSPAAQESASHKNGGGSSGLVIGGVVLLVVVLGLGGLWFARSRASQA